MSLKKQLFFIHVEKAGGITIHNILHNNYLGYISPNPDIEFGEFYSSEQILSWQKLYPFKFNGIGGHRLLAPNYLKANMPKPFFFSILREPYSRYLSHLNWQISKMDKGWTLESFAKDKQFNNFQCMRICGTPNAEKAIEVVDSMFDLVGLVEYYDETLVILKHLLANSSFDIRYEKQNISTAKMISYRWKDLTKAQQETVRSANEEDLQLYNYIKHTFYPKLQSSVPNIAKKLQEFGQKNQLFKFPKKTIVKRKLSNKFMSNVVQPLTKNNK